MSVDVLVRDAEVMRHEDVASGQAPVFRLDLVGFWNPDLLKSIVGHHLGLDKVNHRFRQLIILALVTHMVIGQIRLVDLPDQGVDRVHRDHDLVGCLRNCSP